MKDENSNIIYSTDHGSVCPDCKKPKDSCICRQIEKKAVPAVSGPIRIRHETAGRKGKGMTLISGLTLSKEGLLDIAKKLKQQFGTGGALKNSVIELQGDHREKSRQILRKLGFKV